MLVSKYRPGTLSMLECRFDKTMHHENSGGEEGIASMLESTYRPGTLTMLECRFNKTTHHPSNNPHVLILKWQESFPCPEVASSSVTSGRLPPSFKISPCLKLQLFFVRIRILDRSTSCRKNHFHLQASPHAARRSHEKIHVNS